MRYDVETAVAELMAGYLNSVCSVDPDQILDKAKCPIVTFYDPMSVDEADRVVIFCPTADSHPESPGNFTVSVEVGLKTLWTQAELKDKFATHFARVNDVRDKLFAADIVSRIATAIAALGITGLFVNHVQTRKRFSTKVVGEKGGWIYSDTSFDVEIAVKSES